MNHSVTCIGSCCRQERIPEAARIIASSLLVDEVAGLQASRDVAVAYGEREMINAIDARIRAIAHETLAND